MSTWAATTGVARFVWTRHRWLLGSCAVFYVATYLASQLLPLDRTALWAQGIYPVLILTPVVLPLMVFVSTGSAFTLDLAGTESRYPVHFLALPLNSRQLVLPFMVGALLVAALLWAVGFVITDGRLLVGPVEVRPQLRDENTGLLAVPFLIASGVAWVQVFVWTSFAHRGTRAWGLVAMVIAHFVLLVLMAGHTLSAPSVMLTCVLSLVVACGVAIWGIGRARCGDPLADAERDAERRARKRSRRKPAPLFASPIAAQAWFEWQAHTARHRSPFLLLVPLILALVQVLTFGAPWEHNASPEPAVLLAKAVGSLAFLGLVLFSLAVLGGPSAASFRSKITWTRNDDFAMPSFFAALPLSTGDLAWTKMKTAARGTAQLIVLVVLLIIVLALLFRQSGLWVTVFETLRDRHGLLEAVLRVVFLPGAIALFIVGSAASVLWTALLGRVWKVAYVPLCILGMGLFILPGASRDHPEWGRWLVSTAPALLPWLALVKVAAFGWLAHRVVRARHYSIRRVASIVAIWIAAVLAIWWLGLRLSPGADISLLYGVVVAMPVLGILGAPLALKVNRTR